MSATLTIEEKRQRSLDRANEIRIGRAALKAEIRAGSTSILDVLDKPPACARSMAVYDLLRAVPWVGRHRALTLCSCAGISSEREVGNLRVAERARLFALLAKPRRGR